MKLVDLFLAADGRLRPAWRFWLFFPVFVLLAIAFSWPARAWFGGRQLGREFEPRALLLGLATSLAAALAAFLLLRWVDRRSFRTLGLWFYGGWGRELGLGLAGGFGVVSVVVGLLWASGTVAWRVDALNPTAVARDAVWYFAVFLPPAASEELLFRGYPFQRLVGALGRFGAVFLLSLFFGLAHLGNPEPTTLSTVNTVLAGIFLAVAYLKTRGLWLPIGLHVSWNYAMGFLYSLPVSGIELARQPLEATIGAPAWLSGGNYGPEGSVLTTGVVLLATVWLARTRRLGVSPALARELQ